MTPRLIVICATCCCLPLVRGGGRSYAVEVDAKSVVRRVVSIDASSKTTDERRQRKHQPGGGGASYAVEVDGKSVVRKASNEEARDLHEIAARRRGLLAGERLAVDRGSESFLNASRSALVTWGMVLLFIAGNVIVGMYYTLPWLHQNMHYITPPGVRVSHTRNANGQSSRSHSRSGSPTGSRSCSPYYRVDSLRADLLQGTSNCGVHLSGVKNVALPAPHTQCLGTTSQALRRPTRRKVSKQVPAHLTASSNFVECTRRRWRNQGLEVPSSIEVLLDDLRAQTGREYDTLNTPDNLEASLRHYGVRTDRRHVGLTSRRALQKEIDDGTCRMLLVVCPESGQAKLVRLVRVLQLNLLARTAQGDQVLCETSRSTLTLRDSSRAGDDSQQQSPDEDKVVKCWLKLSIEGEEDAQTALRKYLEQMFGLGAGWQDRNLFGVSLKPPELEQKDSSQFPGLETWYLIEPVHVVLGDVSSNDGAAIGLPAGTAFKTEHVQHANRMLREVRTFDWMDSRVAQGWIKGTHTSEKQEAGTMVERAAATRAWARGVSNEWRAKQQQISSDVLIFVTKLAEQEQEEYEMVNGPTHMEDTLTEFGINVDVESLQHEVICGRCQLLGLNPTQCQSSGSPSISVPILPYRPDCLKQVVRFVRILRVKLKANTSSGKRVLVEGSQSCKDEKMYTSFKQFDLRLLGVKMCLDEVDVNVSLNEHLFRVFGMTASWQEQYLRVGKRDDPKLMVGESRNFPGLLTWFLVEDLEVNVDDDATEPGNLGLPDGTGFSKEFAKSGGKHAKWAMKHLCWAEEDEDLFKSFADQ